MIPKGQYHFTGVAGVGMSSIAQVVLYAKYTFHFNGRKKEARSFEKGEI